MEIKNPFTSSNNLVSNFADFPPFGLYDIFNYLTRQSTEYDKQGLAAYKSLEEYRLFQDGYVESLLTEILSNERLHLHMGMKDKTDEGKSFYDCWFIIYIYLKARCRCKGRECVLHLPQAHLLTIIDYHKSANNALSMHHTNATRR